MVGVMDETEAADVDVALVPIAAVVLREESRRTMNGNSTSLNINSIDGVRYWRQPEGPIESMSCVRVSYNFIRSWGAAKPIVLLELVRLW